MKNDTLDTLTVRHQQLLDLWSRCSSLVLHRQALLDSLQAQVQQLRDRHQELGEHMARRNGTFPFSSSAPLADRFGLTPRELEVTILLAAGRSNAAIAAALNISPHTARHHTQHVLAKLGCHARAEVGALLRD